MRIGFVCTNYNNAGFTRGAVASLHADGPRSDVVVAVVDNASRAADVQALRTIARDFPGVELIEGDRNLGYFPGLNRGIRHLRERFPDVRVMVVGNNDLEFPSGFIDNLIQHAAVLDEWAVVAPDLVGPGGVHQNPHVLHPISRSRKVVWDAYYSSYAAASLVRRAARLTRRFTTRAENDPASELHRTAGPIEQGYGACYLLGPRFFASFPCLSAPTFLMQEEFFLGEQLKTIGQMTYYDPRFVVHHHHHATMGAMPGRQHWAISRASHRTYKRYLSLSAGARRELIDAAMAEPA